MSSLSRPSGPLPAAVYWRRRIVVLGTALLLVVALGKLLTLGSDGADAPQGETVAQQTSPQPEDDPTAGTAEETPKKDRKKKPKRTKTPLPEPDGPCDPGDVVIEPAVEKAYADDSIELTVEVGTVTTPACLFTFDRRSVSLRITSGKDQIWTSQQCRRAVPSRELVLRSSERVKVDFTWSGRRSNDGCTATADWALPGYYHLTASALGGEPSDDQFELRPPKPVTVTQTPEPEDDKKKKKKRDR